MNNLDTLVNALAHAVSENIAIWALIWICLFGMWSAVRLQINGSIRWQTGFVGPDGTIDWMRTAVLVSLIASTWILCALTNDFVKNAGDLEALFKWYALYLAIWSGAPIVVQMVEIARARWGLPPTEPPKKP